MAFKSTYGCHANGRQHASDQLKKHRVKGEQRTHVTTLNQSDYKETHSVDSVDQATSTIVSSRTGIMPLTISATQRRLFYVLLGDTFIFCRGSVCTLN